MVLPIATREADKEIRSTEPESAEPGDGILDSEEDSDTNELSQSIYLVGNRCARMGVCVTRHTYLYSH